MTQQDLNALYASIEQLANKTHWPAERLDFAAEVIDAVDKYVRGLPSPRSDELDYLSRATVAAAHGPYTSAAFPGLVAAVTAALPGTTPKDRSQFLWGVVTRMRQREVAQNDFPEAVERLGDLRTVVGDILPED
jgi:hypothetical protein